MKKVNINEVPKDYRRNYIVEAIEIGKIMLSGTAFGIVLATMITFLSNL